MQLEKHRKAMKIFTHGLLHKQHEIHKIRTILISASLGFLFRGFMQWNFSLKVLIKQARLYGFLLYFIRIWQEQNGDKGWDKFVHLMVHVFIRNHFISNLVLDSLKLKKLSELQGKTLETFDKCHIQIVAWFNAKLYQNNVNLTLL